MRIQHNIPAMNAYRNLNNNQNAISGNLEKLSSGYKINRAGDDAAGLAISEKMRAQITGLTTASKNVKDGISLVKTAEGALQEVHDMLNRMEELALQSANGTYDNDVDRKNLQKEVTALIEEIDRIAQSANFNGIELLDGSLDFTSGVTANINVGGLVGAGSSTLAITTTTEDGTFNRTTIASFSTDTMVIGITNADGTKASVDISGIASDLATTSDNHASAIAAINGALGSKGTATINSTTGAVTITLAEEGAEFGWLGEGTDADVGARTNLTNTGVDIKAGQSVNLDGYTFTENDKLVINGVTFEFSSENLDNDNADEDHYYIAVTDATGADIAQATIQAALNTAMGKAGIEGKVDGGILSVENVADSGGLTLQIGDTSESFNQLTVKVEDCSSSNIGDGTNFIADVDIGNQDGASAAVDVIKAAINQISGTRGDLGALQNRLEHTANNLSVMTENIQDAESTIRDTDVAEEMMEYTKNNILIQSAQSMLAQANQLPQGVLQLMG